MQDNKPAESDCDISHASSAVVVGLCAHGLGIVRDLYNNGVHVVALETNRSIPGVKTRCAEIEFVEEINTEGLIDALINLAERRGFSTKPVLFLTNDRMVETIGRHVQLIANYYKLSWIDVAREVLPLLNKKNIEARCGETGLNYPRSIMLEETLSMVEQIRDFTFPIILKPTRPLSEFKTLLLASSELSVNEKEIISSCLPVLAQEFIPGDDSCIHFGAIFLHEGNVLARFEGRKLRSRPMGHTTIAIPAPSDEIHRLTKQFFHGKKLSGPVSLELKKASDGGFWVIEPTVGRTDFWAGICTANGINLPVIEYLQMIGRPQFEPTTCKPCLWVNGERDPGALLWLLFNFPGFLRRFSIRGVYLNFSDPLPAMRFLKQHLQGLIPRSFRKIKRLAVR